MFWVWSGHDFDQMFRTSILDSNPFPECCGRRSVESASDSVLKTCIWLDICVLFSKHDSENLWEHECKLVLIKPRLLSSDCFLTLQQLLWRNPVACTQPRPRNHVLLSWVIILNKQYYSFTSTFSCGDLWTWGTKASPRTIHLKNRCWSRCHTCRWLTRYHSTSAG